MSLRNHLLVRFTGIERELGAEAVGSASAARWNQQWQSDAKHEDGIDQRSGGTGLGWRGMKRVTSEASSRADFLSLPHRLLAGSSSI